MVVKGKTTFADRLNEVCDDKRMVAGHGRQSALGRQFKVSQQAAAKWLAGTSTPRDNKAREIAVWGGVSYEWLQTGRRWRPIRCAR